MRATLPALLIWAFIVWLMPFFSFGEIFISMIAMGVLLVLYIALQFACVWIDDWRLSRD